MTFIDLTTTELSNKLANKDDIIVLDSRKPECFAKGNIDGSINLSESNIYEILNKIDFNTEIAVICYKGISSQRIAQYLINYGFNTVYNITGGYENWKQNKR